MNIVILEYCNLIGLHSSVQQYKCYISVSPGHLSEREQGHAQLGSYCTSDNYMYVDLVSSSSIYDLHDVHVRTRTVLWLNLISIH